MGVEIKQGLSLLAKKILSVLKELQEMPVLDLSRFDVKDGRDWNIEYHTTYIAKAQKMMNACEQLSWDWAKMTPWQKMCVYKVSNRDGVDCDVALRNVVIYWLAFYKDDEMQEIREQDGKPGYYELVSKQGGILRGDTMNSYAITVREKLNMLPDTPEDKNTMKAKGIITGEKTRNGYYYLADKYPEKPWNAAVLEHYEYFKKILSSDFDKLEMFVSLVHTLGNFIPLPDGLNFPRGSHQKSADYWDLALLAIYQHYKKPEFEKCTLGWVFGPKNEDICVKWLNGLDKRSDGWNHFVEQNFLQDFVNRKDDGNYGRPKELWNKHFECLDEKSTKEVLPVEKEEFSEFFTNASAWILARGVRIALAVKDQLTDLPEEKLRELARRMAGEEGK